MKKPFVLAAAALLFAALLPLTGCSLLEQVTAPRDDTPTGKTASVVINEVVSTNVRSRQDLVYGTPDWVELKNTSSEAADISGWKLADNAAFDSALVFPEGTSIAPDDYIAVLCVSELYGNITLDSGVFAAPFAISREGERLYFASDAQTVTLDVPALDADVSYARRDNGTYGYSASPTFRAANRDIVDRLDNPDVVVTVEKELEFSELVTGSEGWVELKNITEHEVSLLGYSLSDRQEDAAKWRFPDVKVPAGGYVVVELNQLDPESPLSASFKVSHDESAIFLFNSLRELDDELTADPAMPDGVSAVKTKDGVAYTSHITKGEANSNETFPEIAWTEMDISDPSTRLYINEVVPSNKYGIVDSYGDRSDWVELFNPSEFPAYLDGYYLSDDPNDPLKFRLPNVALLPGEYCVIFLSGNETVDGEIHAPFKLSSEDPGIYLSTLDGMKTDCLLIPEGLIENASVGRDEELNILYFAAPTPGEANTTFGFADVTAMMTFDPNSVYISEVLAVSAPKSEGTDWIEIVNCSAYTMDLAGWSITDDPFEPRKFMLDGYTLSAGGFGVVNCDKDSRSSSTAHFSISGGGKTLYLVNADGAFADVFATGMTTLGVTSGRADRTQTGERCFFSSATRGSRNGTPLEGIVHEPVFSSADLYFEGSAKAEISCSTAGASIRYTTDGSVPTASSRLYEGPIEIGSNTVVKARAFLDGFAASPVAAHTYLIDESFTMPVVSLSLSSSDFSSMYTASMNEFGGVRHGPQVSCFMEYYVDGKLAVSTGAGVRVSGASTSLHSQKSLGLYFRAGYGRSSLDFPLFDGCDVTSFRSIVLRNSGQDASYARLRDSYMSALCQGMNMDVAYFRPVIVFINGNYYGIYDMKENMNEDYVAAHHGVERSTVNIIKRNGKELAGSSTDWYNLRSFLTSNNFANTANYERLKEKVDVVAVMDYLIARTYFYDQDIFNQKYWRTTDYQLKWRPVFYDSDYALFNNSSSMNILPAYFSVNGVAAAHGSITHLDMYVACKQNQEWRDEFITRYIYYTKYVFNAENALRVFDELVETYRPEMRRHIQRWHMPSSMSSWEHEVSALRNCIERRPDYALRNLKSYFSLSSEQMERYEQLADELAGSR